MLYWFSSASSKVSETIVWNLSACDCGVSALPARSVEKKLTVASCFSVNGPV